MQKITPCLWYDDQAEEAARHYVSIFKNSSINDITRYSDAGPGPAGSVMTVNFSLDGQEFVGLNGGPIFTFSEAISFQVFCETQEEIDYFWDKLSDGGSKGQCGWLKDKYGVSWQIVPTVLPKLLQDKDTAVSGRVTRAMLRMTKLDISLLKQAHERS
jgi:predicted 3-demethylubiquinone-9 3-methyltransferase (glyoxalase superfamily)